MLSVAPMADGAMATEGLCGGLGSQGDREEYTTPLIWSFRLGQDLGELHRLVAETVTGPILNSFLGQTVVSAAIINSHRYLLFWSVRSKLYMNT
jgi:hypothetical protein